MWLMYPIGPDDIRTARRGVKVLLAASALWYSALAILLTVWNEPILEKIHGKFVELPESPRQSLPFLLLLVAFAGTAGLRLLGYRLCRVTAGAMAVPESVSLGLLGAAVYLGACGTVFFGFTGLLALVAVCGSAAELKFLRFPATLFGLCVSRDAVRKLNLYFLARAVWLGLIVPAGLIMLLAHILIDIPAVDGGLHQHTIRTLNGFLHIVFKVLALLALLTLPVTVGSYWLLLIALHAMLPRILDPSGPVVQQEPAERPGFDQLKQALQPQTW